MRKRIAAILLALAVILCSAPAEGIFAASNINIDDAAVYYTPSNDYQSGDCILTATKCMIRRASIIRGSRAWSAITNQTLRSSATVNGLLLNSFTFEADGLSYKVNSGNFSGSGDVARIKEFENLLKQHPEGIVVWGSNASKSGIHGVLVTSVKNGVAYAADSLNNTGNVNQGIQKWSDTSMKGESNVTKYWYISEVGLAKNAPAPAAGQPIKPLSATDGNYASTLSISDATIPGDMNEGNTFSVRGVISSNYRITKVTVGVYNSSGKAVTSKTVKPSAWTYNIKSIDNYIKFGTLPMGTYDYKVSATDENKSMVLINRTFTVKGVSKLKIKSYKAPKKIKKGKSYNVKGKITSNKKIKKVTITVTTAEGALKYKVSAKPKAKSYNIKKLGSRIKFKKLKKGTYIFTVTATDTVKTKTLVNKQFVVY